MGPHSRLRLSAVIQAAAFIFLSIAVNMGCARHAKNEAAKEEAGRPNIFLVTIDSLRADQLGCYGQTYTKTPVMDAFSAESVKFEQAFPSIPFTLPSVYSIMTSKFPFNFHLHSGLQQRMKDDRNSLLPVIMKKNGYSTAAVSGSHVLHGDSGFAEGFDIFIDSGTRTMLPSGDTAGSTIEVIEKFANDAAIRDGGKSFFLWTHFMDPHKPFTPPDEFDVYKNNVEAEYGYEAGRDKGKKEYAHKYRQRIRGKYRGEVTYTDECLGQVLDKLRKTGLYGNTVIILTADHGFAFALHDHYGGYKYTLYQDTVRVPLMLKGPGFAAGKIIDNPVSLLDIMPTVLDAAGIPTDGIGIEGSSLVPLIKGSPPGTKRRPVYSRTLGFTDKEEVETFRKMFRDELAYRHAIPRSGGQWTMVVSGDYKLIRIPTTKGLETELYNISDDFLEQDNLVDSEREPARGLDAGIDSFLEVASKHRNGDEITPDNLRRLRELGYVE